jgi:Gpi18-like mannosyltransferase
MPSFLFTLPNLRVRGHYELKIKNLRVLSMACSVS